MVSLASAEQKAGLAAGRRALLSAIVSSGVLRIHRVVVMFDAAGETPPSEPSPHPMLSVRFSGAAAGADAAIVALLARGGEASKSVTVVTAGRDLAWEVTKIGAAVVSPESWEPLKPVTRRGRKPPSRTAASEKPRASSRDVDYWLEIFRDESENE